MKPLPALYCPTVADKLAALKVIYANGWHMASFETYKIADDKMREYQSDSQNPYVCLATDRRFYVHKVMYSDGYLGPIGGTLVNSPVHLASYCLTLGDRAPKVFTLAP